jgi:hypothetical protein
MPAVSQAAPRGAGAQAGGLATERPARGRVVVLNALPLNSLPKMHLQLDVLPAGSIHELALWVQRRLQEGFQLIHYIRHVATIQALRSAGIPLSEAPNTGLYAYQPGDIIVVVSLRAPVRGQEVLQVSPQDLEAWIVAAPSL